MSSVAAPLGASTALDLDAICDEERLRVMWQTAEDFGDRRRIRARMYRLREERLREMMQNDEEALGTLNIADDGQNSTLTTETINVSNDGKTSRRSSNIQVTMHVDGKTAVTDSISTQNVRLGGLTMRDMDTVNVDAEDIIQERIRKASKDRTTRFQQIIGDISDNDGHSDGDAVVSITKSTYSIHSNSLAGEGYISMKNKEVRDSVSPTRIMRERRSSAEEETSANEGRLTSDDEAVLKSESENVIKAIETSVPKTSSSRKTSRDERTSTTKSSKTRQSEIPVRREATRKVSERKTSRELDLSSARRTTGDKSSPTSPTKRTPGESPTKTTTHASRKTSTTKESPIPSSKVSSKTNAKTTTSKNTKLAEIEAKMETSIMSELDKLDSYLSASVDDDDDEVILEEEEDCVDDSGNVVKMLVQTRRKKDGTECTARRVARTTKIVNSESEIDEILIGNPDHEVIERNVAEEEDNDGNKIKIITETRERPDGIVYTTKNILKTSKIFDYDHPEDVAYNEEDELISTDETEETDENGCTIQTVTETRRKANGIEYTTKKVYKTSKVKSTQISPSDDDEVIDTKETEEKKEDGSIIRTLIETRRTKNGEEYTHRQVFKSRRMTLSGVDLQKGLPTMQNDDEVLNKEEKEEIDENGMKIRIVTETRQRKDGSTYSFDYVLRSFQGTEEDMKKMPITASTNIAVSAEDELLNEEVKEEVQEDGSTVKTIIERRRAKDGTEYLRHRVMRIPKMPEPVLQVANLDDEVLQEEVNEQTLDDGTQYKAVTERRRSSVSGIQYTLRRMSKIYQQATIHPKTSEDEILDENVVEEETDEGTTIKTVIQRYQRPDGSVYTTHNVHKMFSSPAPVTFVGTDEDELIDQTVDEQETEDGCVIKTVTETRKRSDGVQYTVERAEKSSKFGPQVHISFNANQPQKPEDVVQVGSLDDTVVSSEEQEYEEEDGTTVKTIIEIRRRVDGTEYTAKTVLRSTPVLVPERETSYVVIKPEGGDEEDESGLFPSLDDELVYTRKREEKDGDGNAITVIIETRQTKSGEKYNLTKRVHTQDVLLTEEGEKEIPRKTMKSTLVANLTSGTTSMHERKKQVKSETTEETNDDVPYGSVSALKNRFAPGSNKTDSSTKSNKPDRLNTSSKKKFFEDAAKEASGKVSSTMSFTPKPLRSKIETESERRLDIMSKSSKDKASIEVKLRVGEEKAKVEDVETRNVTYHSDEVDAEETEVTNTESMDFDGQTKPEDSEEYDKPETDPEPAEDMSEPEPEDSLPVEEEPRDRQPKKAETTKKQSTLSRKPEEKPKRRQDVSPKKKPEPSSPTRRAPSHREPIAPKEPAKRAPKPNTSPQRVPNSPRRGRSPHRSGVSTPRDVTPTGRQCCQRHRDANANANAPETVSPTRTQKSPRSTVPTSKKPGSPEGKPRMNGDVRRTPGESKMNGDVKKPDDRTPRTRRPLDKPSEPERSTTRPSRLNQTPRKAPTARSPEKREPTRPLSSRASGKKVPSKPTEPEPKGKPKSSLPLPEPADPVVSHPETPMTENIKPLPQDDDDDDLVIEDVSNEPDLPYHKIHRPSLVREPSEYPEVDETNDQPEDAFEESAEEPDEKEAVKEETIKSRKPKPLESRPSDKSLASKKPETKRPLRDRPWLTEKRNSFEKKPSESKLSADKKKLFERKPSDDKLKKPKEDTKPIRKVQPEDSYPSEDEGKENGMPDTKDAPSSQEITESTSKVNKKTEEISSRYIEDVEKSIESQVVVDKNVSKDEVSARRSMFSRGSPSDKKSSTPTRKPSYEIKESVFAKRSMFEQAKQDSVPTPIKRPIVKTPLKRDDSYKKLGEMKPVKEPIIVPKYFHPLGEDVDESEKKVVEEEVELSSSKLVMNASAEVTRRNTRSELLKPEEDDDIVTPLKKERSPSPFSKESSPVPRSKEGSPAPFSKEGSPTPFNKEGSPTPFSKEGSPTRFATGKPVDSGINSNKIRRIERTASNKKIFEDLEVSRETLPEYIKNIDNIFDSVVLDSMLEQAQTYEERRIVRGQIRIAKKHNSTSTTLTTTSSSSSYNRFITTSRPSPTASPQPTRRQETKPAKVEEPKESNLSETSFKPLSKSEDYEPSTEDALDSIPANEPESPRRKISKDEPPKETTRDPSPETRPTRRFNIRSMPRDPSPEPQETLESPRSRKQDDEMSSPRETKREPKVEEPRRLFGRSAPSEEPKKYGRSAPTEEPKKYGRSAAPEEPKKYESPSKARETSRPATRSQPFISKAAPSNEPYSEPLRYQKKQGANAPAKPVAAQPLSDVDKIVSAYGVGVTDDNGMPVFGLRALKKRAPAAVPVESTPREDDKPASSIVEPLESSTPQEKEEKEYVPTDASGQPIFGIRALKKATSSVTATEKAIERSEVQETRGTASSSVVESSRLVSGIVTQRQTHASK